MPIRLRAGAMPVFSPLGRRVFSCRPLVALAVLVAGCDSDAAPASHETASFIRDDTGRSVATEPTPRRIVSLLPSATEVLVALGASSRLVARTAYDADGRLSYLPSFGETLSPSLERIVALRPDLVVTGSDVLTSGLAARLAATGLRVFELDAQRTEPVLHVITRLSVVVGQAARGRELRGELQRTLDSLAAANASRDRPTVAYLLWHAPPFIAGRETYIDDLVRAAGGENVFADIRGWSAVSLEELIARDPELIILPRGEERSLRPEWLEAEPSWRGVRAVRERRLLVVEDDLFNRPGPRLGEAARMLSAALRQRGGSP